MISTPTTTPSPKQTLMAQVQGSIQLGQKLRAETVALIAEADASIAAIHNLSDAQVSPNTKRKKAPKRTVVAE